MSSLTSLSLSPTPLVTFNVKTPSRTLDAVVASGRFNVHVLTGDAAGTRVAEWFASGNWGFDPFEGVERAGVVVEDNAPGRIKGGVAGLGTGIVLKGEGVAAVVTCKVEQALEVRDHVIVVGEVDGIGGLAEGELEVGLGYADRAYRRAGEVISKHTEKR